MDKANPSTYRELTHFKTMETLLRNYKNAPDYQQFLIIMFIILLMFFLVAIMAHITQKAREHLDARSGIIILDLKSKHFKDSDFVKHDRNPIAKALKEKFPNAEISEDVSHCSIDNVKYNHEYYSYRIFIVDKDEALVSANNNEIVRTIILHRNEFTIKNDKRRSQKGSVKSHS